MLMEDSDQDCAASGTNVDVACVVPTTDCLQFPTNHSDNALIRAANYQSDNNSSAPAGESSLQRANVWMVEAI